MKSRPEGCTTLHGKQGWGYFSHSPVQTSLSGPSKGESNVVLHLASTPNTLCEL